MSRVKTNPPPVNHGVVGSSPTRGATENPAPSRVRDISKEGEGRSIRVKHGKARRRTGAPKTKS